MYNENLSIEEQYKQKYNEELPNNIKELMSFKEFLNLDALEGELKEAFDSKFKIDRKYKQRNVEFYELSISEHKYRIVIEYASYNEIQIVFELFDGKRYRVDGIHNTLNTKEILGLFGTILDILKKIEPRAIYIETPEDKKHRLYLRMLRKLKDEFDMSDVIFTDEGILAIKYNENDFKVGVPSNPKLNFKYKGNQ